jgi:hypothetical protein
MPEHLTFKVRFPTKTMVKYLLFILSLAALSLQAQKSLLEDNIDIKIYLDKENDKIQASALPELKKESKLYKYEKRFYYLLMNVPEIHRREKGEERLKINNLYPDTAEIKKQYLIKYTEDKKLADYFERSFAPIKDPTAVRSATYTIDELMDVSSKFFYCDLVNPDTTVRAHVCVGLNGIKEAEWKKDLILLEAFCFEGIFMQFDNKRSKIWDNFVEEKKKSGEKYKSSIRSLDQYLIAVKLDLFERMKNNAVLKKELLAYYEKNKANLSFRLIK